MWDSFGFSVNFEVVAIGESFKNDFLAFLKSNLVQKLSVKVP